MADNLSYNTKVSVFDKWDVSLKNSEKQPVFSFVQMQLIRDAF